MTAAPAALIAAVSAPNPPSTTTAGNGPEPLGSSTLAEKLELRPPWATLTVMVVEDTVPETVAGLTGFSPYTNFSASFLISARRQRQSSRVLMRVPFSRVNGSGSLVIVGSAPASGSAGTAHPAPSSSTVDAAAAGVIVGSRVTPAT